jgi:hypothetical protein
MSGEMNIRNLIITALLALLSGSLIYIRNQKRVIEQLNVIAVSSFSSNAAAILYLNKGDSDAAKKYIAGTLRVVALDLVAYQIDTPDSLNFLRQLLQYKAQYKDLGLTSSEWKMIENFLTDNTR